MGESMVKAAPLQILRRMDPFWVAVCQQDGKLWSPSIKGGGGVVEEWPAESAGMSASFPQRSS